MTNKLNTSGKKGKNTFSTKTGYYVPHHPEKYNGDVTNCYHRSQLELTFMEWLDRTPRVLSWNSEEVVIPYEFINPMTSSVSTKAKPIGMYDGVEAPWEVYEKFKKKEGVHKYHMDFWVRLKCYDHFNHEDKIIEFLVEVKHSDDCVEPVMPKAGSRATFWKKELKWYENAYKWTTARRWGEKQSMIFLVLTEKSLTKWVNL